MAKKELTFEEAYKQLEEIVEKLENGDIPLEESISIFKEGTDLSKTCFDKLNQAEKEIKTLVEENGEISTTIYDNEEKK